MATPLKSSNDKPVISYRRFSIFVNAEDDCDVAMHRQQQQQLHTYVRGVDVVQRREEWPRRTNQNPSFVVRGAKPHAFLRSSFFFVPAAAAHNS